MTREEIFSIPAGKEMDKLIAEKVMGLLPCNHWSILQFSVMGNIYKRNEDTCEHKSGTCYPAIEAPSYSSNISATWQVVEKIANPDRDILISNEGGKYLCDIIDYENGIDGPEPRTKWSSGYSLSAPLAICRSVLLSIQE